MPSNKEEKDNVENLEEVQKDPNKSEDDPIIPDEILDGIEDKDDRSFIRKSLSFMGSFPMPNPFAKKVTSEHIDKLIDNSGKQDERDFIDKQRDRLFIGFIILVSIFFVSFLIYIFKDKNDVLIPLITGLLSFLGGFGVGKSTKK